MRAPTVTVVLIALAAPGLSAQHDHAPYAGMETAEGTTLTPREIEQLRSGEGMRLALPAELNRHPGPKHVLELADALDLTPVQVTDIEAIRQTMRRDAVRKGEEIITVEGHLADAFRGQTADPEQVGRITRHLGSLRAELQAIHLLAHIAARLELTDHQIRLYERLRGYGSGE